MPVTIYYANLCFSAAICLTCILEETAVLSETFGSTLAPPRRKELHLLSLGAV
jgi:hypothetical protein